MNDDSFSVLARKIRSKKLNKEDIENLKKEAIESKIERNRRQKKAIEIQRIIRGYLARKKFKILEEKMNINTIIDYLYEKKLKRIHKHSSRIITYFLFKYIERQRKIKNKLINEFKIHCSDLIKAFLRGIILRKQIKGQLELIRRNKKILSPYFLSFKTRLMLKCNTIQNILADIANIKFLLQDEKEQNQNEESKQGINELKLKLRKKYNEFYLIFYQNKMTCEWVDEERTQDPWLKKYHKILNGEETSYLKKNNGENINDITNNNNGVDNNKKTKKSENDISDINNNKFNDYDYSQNDNNYDNNYNEEYSNSNNNNMNKTPQMYKEDERPIKPMKNNNFINSENPFGLSEKGFPQDHKYNNYIGNNNQKKLTNPKSKIKRNTTNNQKKIPNQNINNDIPSSFSHLLNQNEEESKSDLQYKENQNKNNINDNQYNYDERPIGVKKIDYKAMFAEGQYFEGDAFGGMNQEININQNQKKIIKNKKKKK